MTLKDYQSDLLNAFEAFLRRSRELKNPEAAFMESTRAALGFALPYTSLPGAPQVPYVCLRVPTGGGKTRIAGQAIARVNRAFLDTDFSLTLWLVPSDPIREQTLRALKTPGELLYADMRDLFGSVNVLTVEEALSVQPATLNSANTIIVATMQSFKREDTVDLRVYRQNGALMPHFSGTSSAQRGEHSLVDALRLRRPFVVVDEAHNQGSPLAVETLLRFDPSCVLELTATPDRSQMPSNVLRSVSAATLQAEDMLKLPVELAVHPQWKVALSEALGRMAALEKDAAAEALDTGELIQPVMLIQAERRDARQETFTPERVKRHLVEDFQIDPARIAIATGALDELAAKRMTDPDYPRYIITVDKLREGWDCPFAYVLFTFRNTTSSTAVEQILGRVLRMPHVTRKRREALNRAYVYAVSDALAQTVEGLRDGLVHNGFERMDTRGMVLAAGDGAADDLFGALQEIVIALPEIDGVVRVPEPGAIESLPKAVRERIEISPETGTMTLKGVVSDAQLRQVAATFSDEQAARTMRERFDSARAGRNAPAVAIESPAERGERFVVPLLLHRQGDFFEVFDQTPLLDADWEITDFDPNLTENEFARDLEAMRRARLSISELEKLQCDVYDRLDSQLALFGRESGWNVADLVGWLDRNIPFYYADRPQKAAWFTATVLHLMDVRGFGLDELAYRKFRLRGALERKLADGLIRAKQGQFDLLLARPEDFATARNEHAVVFEQGRYGYDYAYSGFINLKRHFFPVIGNLKAEGEEFECAEFLANQLPGVAWWVRNVEKKPGSFWLQTASDRFYPDFVVKMESGLVLALEYKGAHIADGRDAREKETIGKLWAARSGGRCDFVMVKDRDWAAISAATVV